MHVHSILNKKRENKIFRRAFHLCILEWVFQVMKRELKLYLITAVSSCEFYENGNLKR